LKHGDASSQCQLIIALTAYVCRWQRKLAAEYWGFIINENGCCYRISFIVCLPVCFNAVKEQNTTGKGCAIPLCGHDSKRVA